MTNPFWMLRSWLGWLNFFVFQWFFVRLQEIGELDENKQWKHLRWEILTFPIPMSGWWTRYVYIYQGAVASRHKKEPTSSVPRYALLKRRLMKQLENGPKSFYTLDKMMREEGFRTSRVIGVALRELVSEGRLRVKARENGKPWLYEKSERTIET